MAIPGPSRENWRRPGDSMTSGARACAPRQGWGRPSTTWLSMPPPLPGRWRPWTWGSDAGAAPPGRMAAAAAPPWREKATSCNCCSTSWPGLSCGWLPTAMIPAPFLMPKAVSSSSSRCFVSIISAKESATRQRRRRSTNWKCSPAPCSKVNMRWNRMCSIAFAGGEEGRGPAARVAKAACFLDLAD